MTDLPDDDRRFAPPPSEDLAAPEPPTRADTEVLDVSQTTQLDVQAPPAASRWEWAEPGSAPADAPAPHRPAGPATESPFGWSWSSEPAADETSAAAAGHGEPFVEGPGPSDPEPETKERRPRRRPGWGALVGTAAAAALVAGGVGGLGGAWLANSGAFDLGRTSYEAPKPGPAAQSRPSGSVASVAANALPSVVTIKVATDNGSATGSGWVFDDQGHLVTNNHVVEGANGGTVDLLLSNGKHVKATVIGQDSSYDLAALKVTDVDLKPLPIGSSAQLVVGDPVIAMGAPLGLESTVTTGIISALNRPVSAGDGQNTSFINAIQTDAAINPGNSGGPLLNMSGQVVGINSAIARLPSQGGTDTGGSIGLGFAIPSDQVRRTVEQLIRYGKAEHPVIGVRLDTQYDGEGVKIASSGSVPVTPGGPADEAGLKAGDVIVAFDGRPMTDPDELIVAIRARAVGEEVTLKVRRGSQEFDAKMTLQKAPNS